MARFHPKSWGNHLMPLEEFPAEYQAEVARLIGLPEPPPRWITFVGGRIESRAWLEWHWARGRLLGRKLKGLGRNRRKIRPALRAAVYERDGHRCLHCGSTENLTLDHIHPFSLGGREVLDNLQTLCRSCNSRKGARV